MEEADWALNDVVVVVPGSCVLRKDAKGASSRNPLNLYSFDSNHQLLSIKLTFPRVATSLNVSRPKPQ